MGYAVIEIPGATVFALCDGSGPFFRPRTEAFPDAGAEAWAAADRLDPAAVDAEGRWILHFHCYAIRFDDGTTALVDAGIGPADAPAKAWAPVPGNLPAQLSLAGIEPSSVDVVVLTHLHTDHVGWAASGLFADARHVLQRADADAVADLNPELEDTLLAPLRADGRLQLVDGSTSLRPGLDVLHTAGHTPGHQVVFAGTGEERLAVTGDLLLHALHLVDPRQRYLFDSDPDAARTARVDLLAALRSGDTLATAHPTLPFHRLG